MDDSERQWTTRDATRERVGPRQCIRCKTLREDLPPSNDLLSIETGETICTDCIDRARRFKRDLDVDLWVDGDLDDHTEDVVRQFFRRLDSGVAEASPVLVRTPTGETLIGYSMDEVPVESIDEAAPEADVK